ncbi:MAG: putative zinc-binding metallopeptidase [Proteobacteria bacterium]|nr:putative zinc-binding metallopeptidase [Pseudomonadota bacterium]
MTMTNFYILLLIALTSYNSHAQEITVGDIKKRVLLMEKKYSLKMHTDYMPYTTWDIDYDFAQGQDYENLYNYLGMFDKELSKYPLSCLKKSKLKRVVFVKNLTIDVDNTAQPRAAIPDYHKDIMIFDFVLGNYDHNYQQSTIHHEFYHMLDEEFNAKADWNDPMWNSFNVNNNVYGANGMYNSIAKDHNHPLKGFIGRSSLFSLEEDKAEVFSALFINGNYEKLTIRVKKDNILFKKVEYIKNFLKGIDRSFSDNYWSKLHD